MIIYFFFSGGQQQRLGQNGHVYKYTHAYVACPVCFSKTAITRPAHTHKIHNQLTYHRDVVNVRDFVLYPVHSTRKLRPAVAMVTPVYCLGREGQGQRAVVTSWSYH